MDPITRERLADLLLEWEDRFQQGEDTPAAVLAGGQSDLVEPLGRWIAILKKTRWLDRPIEPDALADDDATPSAGGRVLAGRYRLDERVGAGGFAEVWRARDLLLQRDVAVKLPKASRLASTEMFLAEARRIARLSHPSILPIHDVGIVDDQCFIVTEYLEGGSVAKRLAEGSIPREDALRWTTQVADALECAHGQGLVHQDVKPANILLNSRGDAVLGDFGIARSASASDSLAPSIGTLRYMSPEHLAGGESTPAADIYSLGVVLHELLTESVPYPSDDPNALRAAIADPAGVRISPTLPATLAGTCRKALAHAPAERHRSAAELAAELREATVAPPHPGSRQRWWAVAGLALIPIVLVAGWLARHDPPSPELPAVELDLQPSGIVPLARPTGSPPKVDYSMLRIEEALPFVVEASNLRQYREWQDAPDTHTYFAPRRDGLEARLVLRFEFPSAVRSASMRCDTFCVDFDRETGGVGRGASSLELSRDGVEWISLGDDIGTKSWGTRRGIDGPVPEAILGGTAIWVRVRLLTEGCPNDDYSVAQFGRPVPGFLGPALRLEAELAPPTAADR